MSKSRSRPKKAAAKSPRNSRPTPSRTQPVSRKSGKLKAAKPVVSSSSNAKTSSSKSATRPDTKHAHIIAMLCAPAGATIAAIVTATKWQPHSVRGFLAGVVRGKLGLNLVSEMDDSGRLYRIKDRTAVVDRSKQTA